MKTKFKVLVNCIVLTSCISITTLSAQVLQDTSSLKLVKKGIDCIYNMEFDEADEIYNSLNQLFPDHPVVILFKGIKTYWENFPLCPSSPFSDSYENDLLTCIELSQKNINPSLNAEFLLTNVCARGMLLSYYADNGLYLDVLSIVNTTYQYIRLTFDYTSVYSDFFFFTGLYNYYREAYPKAHPIYKPIAFFFPKGSRAKGVKELQTASASIFLKAESLFFLSLIYLSYENDYKQALYFSKQLHDLYPNNLEYLAMNIKALLLIKHYDEAETLMLDSTISTNYSYFKAQLTIFKGILQEKKYKNYSLSKEYYQKGIKEMAKFGEYGNDFASYAYFGLSRISEANDDKYNKRIYRKKAIELAYLKKINFDD